MMRTNLSKWGNSLATRIPASFATQLHLEVNTPVEIKIEGQSIVITPIYKRCTLDDLLAQMDDTQAEETEWGDTQGKEVFWE